MNGTRQVAEGMIAAKNWFIDLVVETIGCTEDQAEAVRVYYVKNRLMKIDHIMRCYHVKHGAFFEPSVLRNAVAEAIK